MSIPELSLLCRWLCRASSSPGTSQTGRALWVPAMSVRRSRQSRWQRRRWDRQDDKPDNHCVFVLLVLSLHSLHICQPWPQVLVKVERRRTNASQGAVCLTLGALCMMQVVLEAGNASSTAGNIAAGGSLQGRFLGTKSSVQTNASNPYGVARPKVSTPRPSALADVQLQQLCFHPVGCADHVHSSLTDNATPTASPAALLPAWKSVVHLCFPHTAGHGIQQSAVHAGWHAALEPRL